MTAERRAQADGERDGVTASNRPGAGVASPPGGKLVELVDRGFAVIAVGFFLLLPTSGWASVMFDSWFDQMRDLIALQSVLEDGRAAAIANDGIGPAYIGAAALVHHVTRIGAEDALVALTQASFVLTIGAGVLLVRALVRRIVGPQTLVSLGAQIVFVALVFAAGTWHWSDVPWSHFFAAFLAVGLYAARYVPARTTALSAGVVGATLALLWLTRSFELLAVATAWLVTLGAFALLRLAGPRRPRAAHLLSAAAAFLATTAAVYLLTGKRDPFFLYEGSLGSQSGSVRATEVAETPTLSLALVPTKLVQLFVDPCFDSLCSVSDYSGQASPSPLLTEEAGNLRLWSLPLGVQLPSLLLIPLCLVVVGALVVLAARQRQRFAEKGRELRLLAEMSLASAAIVLGYTSSTLTGPAHLRYGFARDFLLPAFLSAIVAISLISIGFWRLLSRRAWSARWSPEFVFVMLSFVASAALVATFAYARSNGIPRIDSRHLASITYTARCGDQCNVAMSAARLGGGAASIPDASVLTFECGRSEPGFTIYVEQLTDAVPLARTCRDPWLVAAWPTVMGLPPGSFELAAVGVRNA
jgi:hypothetical protein